MAADGRGSQARASRACLLSLPSPSSAAAAAAEAAALAIAAGGRRLRGAGAVAVSTAQAHGSAAALSYFSPGAAATRRPPAGRPARPAACTLPPPAPGLGPCRIRPASGGGPGPAQSNRHPEDAQAALGPRRPGGLGREALPSREPQGSGLPRRLRLSGPRLPSNPELGSGPPAGSGAGGPGERAGPGSGRWAGCLGQDPWLPTGPFGPSRVWSARGAARRAGLGRGSRCLLRERRQVLWATSEACLPPGWRGLVTQVYWGTLEYGALPTFLQVRRRPGRQRRQFEEEGAKSFCTQK
ncbi:Protein Transport Protein Sec24D [Manis pentadactyla]|nr:Protein Transport Protein Sec24D [Manis pentadactyla]